MSLHFWDASLFSRYFDFIRFLAIFSVYVWCAISRDNFVYLYTALALVNEPQPPDWTHLTSFSHSNFGGSNRCRLVISCLSGAHDYGWDSSNKSVHKRFAQQNDSPKVRAECSLDFFWKTFGCPVPAALEFLLQKLEAPLQFHTLRLIYSPARLLAVSHVRLATLAASWQSEI